MELQATIPLDNVNSIEIWQTPKTSVDRKQLDLLRPVSAFPFKMRNRYGYTKRYVRNYLTPFAGENLFTSSVCHTFYKPLPPILHTYFQQIQEVNKIHNGGYASVNQVNVSWMLPGGGLGAHQDGAKKLSHPDIYTLGVYGSREIVIKSVKTKEIVKKIISRQGEIYVMRGATFQDLYTHEVSKKGKDRMSITLRSAICDGSPGQDVTDKKRCFCVCDVCTLSKLFPVMEGKHYACTDNCEISASCGCACKHCRSDNCKKCIDRCFYLHKPESKQVCHNDVDFREILTRQYNTFFDWAEFFMREIGVECDTASKIFALDFARKWIDGVQYPQKFNTKKDKIWDQDFRLDVSNLHRYIPCFVKKRKLPELAPVTKRYKSDFLPETLGSCESDSDDESVVIID
jgi:alkylated DNA repair dioxygenase AlkB